MKRESVGDGLRTGTGEDLGARGATGACFGAGEPPKKLKAAGLLFFSTTGSGAGAGAGVGGGVEVLVPKKEFSASVIALGAILILSTVSFGGEVFGVAGMALGSTLGSGFAAGWNKEANGDEATAINRLHQRE